MILEIEAYQHWIKHSLQKVLSYSRVASAGAEHIPANSVLHFLHWGSLPLLLFIAGVDLHLKRNPQYKIFCSKTLQNLLCLLTSHHVGPER